MPWFDLPLNQLREYRTDTAEPADLDLWWRRRLDEARAAGRPPTLTRYEADTYAPVEVFDTEFSGAGGDRIRAWYLRPPGAPSAIRTRDLLLRRSSRSPALPASSLFGRRMSLSESDRCSLRFIAQSGTQRARLIPGEPVLR